MALFPTDDRPPHPPPGATPVVSWDTATKDKEVHDYSVGIVALIKPNKWIYILDVIRVRFTFPALRQRVIEEARKRRASFTLIEEAGSGMILLQELRGKISAFG